MVSNVDARGSTNTPTNYTPSTDTHTTPTHLRKLVKLFCDEIPESDFVVDRATHLRKSNASVNSHAVRMNSRTQHIPIPDMVESEGYVPEGSLRGMTDNGGSGITDRDRHCDRQKSDMCSGTVR